ncbi:hypothetical protein UA08_09487 [Talaromyces atroroseus]|uniref:Uncharacterized protein n=1 Tax=Talaromyces atroroseus TaxID=1441469 RepID=A0A1Q5Q6B0_TALAT|nr:hypothetical protein UA08_09487 [Talaromyces atroroseus]OKL55243.1 hypothetical protein UA08_09487 [Talaromyces atroroseus]
MTAVDEFFESLSKTTAALDRDKSFLNAKQYSNLLSAFILIRHGHTSAGASRATSSRYNRAQQHLRNALSLGNGHLKHDDLFPRLETWFKDHPVSKTLESLALRQIDLVQKDIDAGHLGPKRKQRRAQKPVRQEKSRTSPQDTSDLSDTLLARQNPDLRSPHRELESPQNPGSNI